MNITMLHDLDTGFLAATLKPAFEALGHKCTVMQTIKTYLETDTPHIDHLMSEMEDKDIHALKDVFKETDMFILRSITDNSLKAIGIIPFITPHNTIWRVHGSEIRLRNVPYSLRTWRINWHNKEPIIVGPRDPSLRPLYRGNVVTQIERPCAFDTFPRKKQHETGYVLHSPTRPDKKGTQELLDAFDDKGSIPLYIMSGASRKQVLKAKAGASYFIDYLGGWVAGPYGMNTVEAWYYRIPVFSLCKPADMVVCPELSSMIHTFKDTNDLKHIIRAYTPDKKQLNNARKYALHTHDPMRIAQQYVNLGKELAE